MSNFEYVIGELETLIEYRVGLLELPDDKHVNHELQNAWLQQLKNAIVLLKSGK